MDIQRTARRFAICIATLLSLLLLVFVGNNVQAATRKYVAMPDNGAVLTSNNTAYLSGNNLWKQGDTMTSYIDRLGRKTPVGGIVPKKAFSLPSIATKFKNLAKGNFASIAMSAAISTALAGVGWVMDEGTKTVSKKTDVPSQSETPGNYSWVLYQLNTQTVTGKASWSSPIALCDAYSQYRLSRFNNTYSANYHAEITTSSTTVNNVSSWTCKTVITGTRYTSGSPPTYSETTNQSLSRQGTGCFGAGETYVESIGSCATTKLVPITESDLDAFDPWMNQQSAAWLSDLLKDMCVGSLKPANCFAELEVAAKQLEGPATADGGTKTKTSTYTRPDGTMGTRTEAEQTTFDLAYGPDYFDYTTKQTTTTTEDGVKTGESTETDGDEVTQEEPKEDTQTDEDEQKEEEPEREASGDACDVPLSCSGDAIDCAVLKQEKDFRCAYEKQVDYDKHKDEIKAAITGDKFEIDDSTEIEIPSFINQGTRFLPSSCPADKSFSLKTGGGRSFVMTYEPLCAAATDLGYLIVIAVGCFCVLYVGRSLGGE